MLTNYALLDLSTAPIASVADVVDPPKTARSADPLDKAALDPDLCRISGVAIQCSGHPSHVELCQGEDDERPKIRTLLTMAHAGVTLVSYNGLGFDWLVLNRRALYLGIRDVPPIAVDKYRSPHVDLLALLSGHDPSRRKSLSWYMRRLGHADLVKPLSGKEEADVFTTGQWDALRASLTHDLEALRRLAVFCGVIAA